MLEYLQYPVIQRALIASVLAGGAFSLLGPVVVTLNLTTIRFALMHMALLGAAVAMALNSPPLIGAIAAIALGSMLLGPWSDRLKLDTGLSSAFFMTGSIAAAFILFHRAGVSAMEAFGLFTGSILATTSIEIWSIVGLGAVIVATYTFMYREIQLVLYDRELATSLGVPVEAIRGILLVLTGLAIGMAMRVVGALLVDGIILLPALSAMLLGRSLKGILVLSSLFGALSAFLGLLGSMAFDLPVGATITLTGVLILGLVSATKSLIQRVSRREITRDRRSVA